jgi:uncharacterized protein
MSSSLHRDSKLNPCQAFTNDSGNASIHELVQQRLVSRRGFLATSMGVTAAVTIGGTVLDALTNPAEAAVGGPSPSPAGGIGFTSVPPNLAATFTDEVSVPQGYSARVLAAWGDPLDMGPAWNPATPMTEAQQLRAFGSHTDGMHYFPFPGGQGNRRGLLAVNNEYCDPPLVNGVTPAADYYDPDFQVTLPMVRAQQAAHGVTIMEVEKDRNGRWAINRRSPFNRRITGNTPCRLSGPVAGSELVRTAVDPTGTRVLGTLNNCAHGYTPWGTYLTCEENWNGYFSNETGDVEGVENLDRKFEIIKGQSRYGIVKGGFGYRWHEADERFRADLNPNEPNRFGWVVEIDPWNPQQHADQAHRAGPLQARERAGGGRRRQQGRLLHGRRRAQRVPVQVRLRQAKLNPAGRRAESRLLDKGTLYVAKFNATAPASGCRWCMGAERPDGGERLPDQAEVLVKTRQAADRLGATMMDRPEWIAAHPVTREVYMTLTNNNRRGGLPASSNARRHEQRRRRASIRWMPPTRARTTTTATSSAGASTTATSAPRRSTGMSS